MVLSDILWQQRYFASKAHVYFQMKGAIAEPVCLDRHVVRFESPLDQILLDNRGFDLLALFFKLYCYSSAIVPGFASVQSRVAVGIDSLSMHLLCCPGI